MVNRRNRFKSVLLLRLAVDAERELSPTLHPIQHSLNMSIQLTKPLLPSSIQPFLYVANNLALLRDQLKLNALPIPECILQMHGKRNQRVSTQLKLLPFSLFTLQTNFRA